MLFRRRGESFLGAQDKALLRAILHARVGYAPLAYPCSLPSEDARVSVIRESLIPTKTEQSAIDYRLSTLPITDGVVVWVAVAVSE